MSEPVDRTLTHSIVRDGVPMILDQPIIPDLRVRAIAELRPALAVSVAPDITPALLQQSLEVFRPFFDPCRGVMEDFLSGLPAREETGKDHNPSHFYGNEAHSHNLSQHSKRVLVHHSPKPAYERNVTSSRVAQLPITGCAGFKVAAPSKASPLTGRRSLGRRASQSTDLNSERN